MKGARKMKLTRHDQEFKRILRALIDEADRSYDEDALRDPEIYTEKLRCHHILGYLKGAAGRETE